jgi:predicted kinase
MRKWMRDRLKGRKKTTESGPTEAAPAPLQPAFYDDVPSRSQAEESVAAAPSQPRPEPAQEPDELDVSPAQPSAEGAGDPRRRRRRRSRGGRGRSRSAVPAAQTAETAGKAQSPSPEAKPAVRAAQADGAPEGSVPLDHPAPPVRAPKGTMVLAIGLPGSGKSAWFKRHNITPLSSDLVRALLFDDATEQRFQDLVFSNLRSMLKARLIARRPMNYVDATNLTPHDRHGWIKLAKDYGYEAQAVFFDVPVEVCLQRNARRERVVPEDVMRRMASKLKPPTFEEGFSKITVVRVKSSPSAKE